jgi:hypothetical protein
MANCKDCIHYEPCYEYGNILDPIHGGVKCDSFKPTADVAPKSEVENYKQVAEYQQKLAMDRYFEIKRLEEEIERLTINMNAYGLTAKRLAEEKNEVDGLPCVAYNKKHERYQVIHKGKQGHIFASKFYRNRKDAENALAELKKKYTEGKK